MGGSFDWLTLRLTDNFEGPGIDWS